MALVVNCEHQADVYKNLVDKMASELLPLLKDCANSSFHFYDENGLITQLYQHYTVLFHLSQEYTKQQFEKDRPKREERIRELKTRLNIK